MLASFFNPLNSGFYLHQSSKIIHSKTSLTSMLPNPMEPHSRVGPILPHPLTLSILHPRHLQSHKFLFSFSSLTALLNISPGYITFYRTQISVSYHNSICQVLNSPSFCLPFTSTPTLSFSVFPISVNGSTANLSISSPNTPVFLY